MRTQQTGRGDRILVGESDMDDGIFFVDFFCDPLAVHRYGMYVRNFDCFRSNSEAIGIQRRFCPSACWFPTGLRRGPVALIAASQPIEKKPGLLGDIPRFLN